MIKLKITKITKIPNKRKVYDLTVSKNHNFFIGNKEEILTHNCTHILQASQVVLLNMIETYSLKTRFILTGNYPERLIEPLRSRLQEFKFEIPSKKVIARHCVDILNSENIKYELEDVATIINNAYPDIRKTINNLQASSYNGLLNTSKSSNNNIDDFKTLIINELSKPTSKSFNNIRQTIANYEMGDNSDIYRVLYENLDKYAKGIEGSVCIILNEHIYQNNFLLDKEINLLSAINKILELK